MPNIVLVSKINQRISELENQDENVIIVLKGIPMELVDSKNAQSIDLESIAKNKLKYLFDIYGKRKYITYEEFLMLNNFVIEQYKTIYILNNNLYMNQYPLDIPFSSEVQNGLINHFKETDDEDDESYIGDIEEIISLYNGVKECNGHLIGVYCDEKIIPNNKIVKINIFDDEDFVLRSTNENCEFIDIVEELDYIELVKLTVTNPKNINIKISNYTGNVNKLKKYLQILAANWRNYTEVFQVQTKEIDNAYEHRDEYNEILKNYWGYENFRQLPIYDMKKLENGKKEITYISHEKIISDLVTQVENCEKNNGSFSDIFVTAPTGAGKSVMFQIPAMYLAEKYNLLTIVISPLIGLMNDQVKNLEIKNYKYAKTINSDISPIIKQEIIERIAEGEYHILYISPETLLSRSDVEQLIGNRTIGMIVIDEAHIVTTWGKQFRPDYWYLGDHIRKLRKKQIQSKGRAFPIATFTATAIYHGLEDMYTETINSLHMLNPIPYIGYIRRKDIDIVIDKSKKNKGERSEYEYDKFEQIEKLIERAQITNKKTLVYFPTVALINRCYEYLRAKQKVQQVAIYHGSLEKDEKAESYEKFYNKEKLVMLATKAFGMGIDINDIELVVHFAPTGNVCDYVQEIGRAARKKDLYGEAFYHYDKRDFKHINRLHGLSTIKRYQLIEVIKKVDELYNNSLRRMKKGDFTRKRNAMLLDAENFTYIFGKTVSDEDNNINKVKTALLLIQKDFESKIGFSPINVKPIPLFSIGFFEIDTETQKRILKKYPECLEEFEHNKHICRVMLDKIWRKDYSKYSFPKFKFLLYSKNDELKFVNDYKVYPALCVSMNYSDDYSSKFETIWAAVKNFINERVLSAKHTAVSEIENVLETECGIGKYKAQAICEVIIASMDSYRKNFAKTTTPIAIEKTTTDGNTKYQFNVAVNSYFQWVERGFAKIISQTVDGELFLINDNGNKTKEVGIILGILETLDILTFEMLGGANSQLYIYINQIQGLKNILNAPNRYNNRLLDTVSERHLISVKMLTYIYEGDFSSDEIWELLENYFLGDIPVKVKHDCKKEKPDINFD